MFKLLGEPSKAKTLLDGKKKKNMASNILKKC